MALVTGSLVTCLSKARLEIYEYLDQAIPYLIHGELYVIQVKIESTIRINYGDYIVTPASHSKWSAGSLLPTSAIGVFFKVREEFRILECEAADFPMHQALCLHTWLHVFCALSPSLCL